MKPLSIWPTALDLAWNEPDKNLSLIDDAISRRLKDQTLVSDELLFLFPELTLTGFVTKDPPGLVLGERPLKELAEIAAARKIAIAAGFPERNPADAKKPFNSLALFGSDGKLVARYRKLHLFTWGKSPESDVYSCGDKGVVCEYRGWKLGLGICFDVRFSGLFHQYARSNVDAMLISACWVGGPHKTYQYKTLCSAHAILTQSFVAAVNRSGRDPAFEYDGAEYGFSPFGEETANGKPLVLDASALEACRKLVVRPSDRDAYEVG
jgi:predicted amidohydrolase